MKKNKLVVAIIMIMMSFVLVHFVSVPVLAANGGTDKNVETEEVVSVEEESDSTHRISIG